MGQEELNNPGGVVGASEALLAPLRDALSKADEPERYRLLADLIGGLAESSRRDNGRAQSDQLAAVHKRAQELEKRRADLEDTLRSTQADLQFREKQQEAEKARAEELQAVLGNQRTRMESLEKQNAELEAEVTRLNNDLHRAESDRDTLQLKVQRSEISAGDSSRFDSLEDQKSELRQEIAALKEEMNRFRDDKNREIERLEAELRESKGSASGGADALLLSMWQRLAGINPQLVKEPHVQPTTQAAERLIDAFAEMAAFVHKSDQDMRVFLNKYTKHSETLRAPWSVYADRDDLFQIIQQTIAQTQGKHVGVLKMKLKMCRNWAFSAMVSNDSTMESIASELQAHLLGEFGAGVNPKCTIKEYVKNSGHESFLEHALRLRGHKLEEVYGYGG